MKPFELVEKYYTVDHLPEFIGEVSEDYLSIKSRGVEYLNVPAAFDIETYSFSVNGTKYATMYVWQFGINGRCIIGRTWDDFLFLLRVLETELGLSIKRRLVVYVHNLEYEFQFMRKWLEWESIFALDERRPVKAVTSGGIEFRCSYILSGYKLELLGKQLIKYKVLKAVGDLDYKLARHSTTPLTNNEIYYCLNDIRVVMAYIQERMESDGDLTKIPLTNTGYVRIFCRDKVLYHGGVHSLGKNNYYSKYRKFIKSLVISAPDYAKLKRAFQGGFTHANSFNVGKTFENVASYDFASSYPAVMVTENYPMSVANKWEMEDPTSQEELDKLAATYGCLFDLDLWGLEPKILADNPISKSKCTVCEGATVANGRVVYAEHIKTTITEQDYFVLRDFYSWDKMEVSDLSVYLMAPLPTEFVLAILDLYKAKTTLKNVEDRKEEYQVKKGMLNSTYGMTVTDIVREIIEYADEWSTTPAKPDEQLKKYNEDPKRFLYYPWGVWITAYARRNLFSGIKEFDEDYIYSDTDSLKVLNHEAHEEYFINYEKQLRSKLQSVADRLNIPFSEFEPEDIKGRKHLIGVWDFEGVYSKFKTMGAKRYIVKEDGKLKITVAGLGKKAGGEYLTKTYGVDGAFDAFDFGLEVPKGCSGKLTHTYIDEPCDGLLTDYLGNTSEFHEKSCVHLEDASFCMSPLQDFINYLNGIRTAEL